MSNTNNTIWFSQIKQYNKMTTGFSCNYKFYKNWCKFASPSFFLLTIVLDKTIFISILINLNEK